MALILCGVLASTLLAQRSLDAHVLAVAKGLETQGLSGGRMAVAQIVGRDTQGLDEAAICRAAIESLAENFSDGVVAPLFWMVVAGLPGALAYKAINTADSMIGHRTERHEAFGWASARFDDLVNLPASRLSALWLVLAAIPLGLSPARRAQRRSGAMRATTARPMPAGRRRRWRARSASACRVRASMTACRSRSAGWARAAASSRRSDIRTALKLYRTACGLQIAVLVADRASACWT